LACSGKVVKKVSPEERVGVICKEDGKPAIIEYYEMPEELAKKRDEDGELTFRYGVTLNYLFSVEGLNRIYKNKLPYHLAKKAIPHIENGVKVTPSQPDGYKFETLAVDLIKLMGSCLAVEIDREKEFAPVKNKTGADSVESARILLKKNGVQL
jgi:UDP-N-acetylglucosamine/UDP-N-acetylgalactosamine diphosphorylase